MFVNLYIQSEYSMLNSTVKISELILKAKEYKLDALAITDTNMHGAVKFYEACKKENIKPLFGLKAHLESKGNFDSYILFFAKNIEGYKNLLKIASRESLSVLNLEFLKTANYDLITVIPGDENEVVKFLLNDNLNNALELLNEYKETFNELYLGWDFQDEKNLNSFELVNNFFKKNNIKKVALNKTNFLVEEDFEAYQVLRCIDLGLNSYTYTEKEKNSFLLSKEEAQFKFKNYQDMLANTRKIADLCDVELDLSKHYLPKFKADLDSKTYLFDLCKLGLNKRLKNKNKNPLVYKERLLHELKIISEMGYSDYFLIVYDYVLYAKKNKIMVGPGRGSAPGSLVSYSLGITEIDPLEHDLLFERFLNPERVSMPDIDIDFPDDKRDMIIKYVGKKYGKHRVAHISTFGTFKVKMALRDIARVMKVNDTMLAEILSEISFYNQTINELIASSSKLQQMIEENEFVKKILDVAMKIEDLPRHISVHAAGIIMGPDDLVNYTALINGPNDIYQTQFEAEDLEKIGLVKMDFLGLRNLTIIDNVCSMVNRLVDQDFNISKISFEDEATYKLIASAKTNGIFQLESSGMRNVLRKLKVSSFIDIVHAIALFRPGPMDEIDNFVRRKFGIDKIVYPHPELKEILESTYGTIVFQEQIMLIASKFAGYSLAMADILRRAVSKKNASILETERINFVAKSIKLGHLETEANEIYDYIVKFANYGFNKSHSVAYSYICYQLAYLKTHYFPYFMAVLLSNSLGSTSLLSTYVQECLSEGIEVLLPSINISSKEFVIRENKIYFSLLGILNVGDTAVSNILEERINGKFESYVDFISRTNKLLNKRVVEYLIYAGALDEFNIPRKQMILEYDNIINLLDYQTTLKTEVEKMSYLKEEFTYEELMENEAKALGFNLKFNIFARNQDLKTKYKITSINDLEENRSYLILGLLYRQKVINTKNNDQMAFLEVKDETTSIDVVVFPNVYGSIKNELATNSLYVLGGRVDVRNEKKQFILEKIYEKK
ncbi:MAG: DNA polymerase III subunit alpha [Bacilli bacterium]